MSIMKLHRYGVHISRHGDGTLDLDAPGKPTLEVATPADFKDGIRGFWGPEELLIGSLASCFELTALALAERRNVPIVSFRTDATGYIESKNGLYRFVVLELDVAIETDAGFEAAAELVAVVAKEHCIVASALDVPVHLTVEARAVEAPAAADHELAAV